MSIFVSHVKFTRYIQRVYFTFCHPRVIYYFCYNYSLLWIDDKQGIPPVWLKVNVLVWRDKRHDIVSDLSAWIHRVVECRTQST